MRIHVIAVRLLEGETVGEFWGLTDDGTVGVHAAGHWRQVMEIGSIGLETGGPVPVEIEDWQILDVTELSKDQLG